MSYTDGPRGVGGWLAFFLVTLGLFGPALEILNTVVQLTNPDIARAYGTRWPSVRIAALVLSGTSILISWFVVGRFLLVRNWRTVRMGIAGLWLQCLINVLVAPLAIAILGGISVQTLFAAMAPSLIRPIAYGTIWTAYLLRSKRVANTYLYPDSRDEAELARVFD
ncbi:DUF2569 family protein [Sphingomonas sp. AOB5]|uniref:DUF2569 family protein n=1 Tax=Sphingomonas sp. AOB5 TaxID=3034017 RepID=UPI0023F96A89|nr:DUF2569 family protein [Sphingomonas sp. AOB5]MDF7777741.1 DUF2569 family protein [Sphingomonas sp. AOB5]